MAQTRKVRGVATKVYTDNGKTNVRYHSTDVVSFDADSITLRSGGWQTATTKNRMNQAACQFDLPYFVYQRNREWYVNYEGMEVEFYDGITFVRRPALAMAA